MCDIHNWCARLHKTTNWKAVQPVIDLNSTRATANTTSYLEYANVAGG